MVNVIPTLVTLHTLRLSGAKTRDVTDPSLVLRVASHSAFYHLRLPCCALKIQNVSKYAHGSSRLSEFCE